MLVVYKGSIYNNLYVLLMTTVMAMIVFPLMANFYLIFNVNEAWSSFLLYVGAREGKGERHISFGTVMT